MRVVLLSGGVESALLVRRLGEDAEALFVDYGQKNAEREREAAVFQAEFAGATLECVSLQELGEQFRSRQRHRLHVPIPHRNLLLVSLAFSWAANVGASAVQLGVNAEDGAHYVSSGAGFVEHIRALCGGLEPELAIEAPLLDLSKADVVRDAARLGVPLERTWSCILDRARHCGRCGQCRGRRAAFEGAGVVERDGFYA